MIAATPQAAPPTASARRGLLAPIAPMIVAPIADEMLSKAEDLGYTHRDIAAWHEVLGRLSNDAAAVTS